MPSARSRLRATVLALAVLLCGAPASAQTPPPVQARQIAERTWFVQGESALGSSANRNFIANAVFFATRDGVLVVDALGSPVLADALLDEIERVTGLPVRLVVVTHYHADHVYGLQAFKARGATVVAHAAGREYLNSETAALRLASSRRDLAPWIDSATRLVPADRWIDGDTTIELGGERFEIRHAGPAHTPEDLTVYAPARRVLVAGDLVFSGRVPFVGQADSRRWLETLDALIALRPAVLVPGHGPASRDPGADLALTRDYLRHLRAAMGEAARNLEPFEDAYARADWSPFERLPLFGAVNRVNAFNMYLQMEREIPR